ncbi:J domain-containing protein [Aphanothece sacrum]|uniref:Molecular chaperone DnaJ n=1 Tax=Aphanothece sacrum FPU1 TaxID=1920663 RepID=A0A401IGN9_APHSA|nr:DnaJ domain-containing protein [Aphanothece sacrum]GBF80445.1 molecular chaperone DnaJ [Aphanothece sacrum FPU1]GBF85526.1 molecular chaperone DnaJ [Aphanothece sacrum FPU3]
MNKLKKSYEVLGVSPDDTKEQIQQAYRDLIQVWYPYSYGYNPRLQKQAKAKLKEINLAYEEIIKSRSSSENTDCATQVNDSQEKNSTEVDFKIFTQFILSLFQLTPEEQQKLEKEIKKKTNVEEKKSQVHFKIYVAYPNSVVTNCDMIGIAVEELHFGLS